MDMSPSRHRSLENRIRETMGTDLSARIVKPPVSILVRSPLPHPADTIDLDLFKKSNDIRRLWINAEFLCLCNLRPSTHKGPLGG